MKMVTTALLATLLSTAGSAQVNLGSQAPEAGLPFTMTQVASFDPPWRMAFLPDGRMLVTEKVGPVWLVTPDGQEDPDHWCARRRLSRAGRDARCLSFAKICH